jgi:hypothetical protein
MTVGKKWDFKLTAIDGEPVPEVSPTEAKAILEDLISRATSWRLTLQLAISFIIIAIWPTAYTVSIVSVFLIWQGTRLVRSALLDHLIPKPTGSSRSSRRVDLEAAFRNVGLGWLLRFRVVQSKIADYNARHPLSEQSIEKKTGP